MIRVLVAEDSPTARRLLVEILRADPDLQVVGEAKDGLEAVEWTRKLRPDIVTMDIQMPRMDGYEATQQIMTDTPTPVVVVSTLVERDIEISMKALRAGALAVLKKLVGPDSPDFESESRRLRDTVKAMSEVKVVRRWPARVQRPKPAAVAPEGRAVAGGLVAMAASTGGPAALQKVLAALPGDFPLPIVVVQHIALGFARGLAEWLGSSTPLKVVVAADGMRPEPGNVYLPPDDRHVGLTEDRLLEVSAASPIKGLRPSATYLFRSVALAFRAQTVAVVLTGMGQDGVDGLRVVHELGGQVFAQDEATSVVFGMPGAAVAAGVVDDVLPLDDLVPRLRTVAGLRP